ncbi:protein unc-13 homolog 4B-like [Culicoides brevitarsis]|uniref:protein unc-13 homolog 4B-like n=1 Tax=Culicoides brevitarsis TaxID=469753 RepID=UPI00307C532C
MTNRDKIYSSLLYQLINSVSLENDNNKLREFTDYLKEIFKYSNEAHKQVFENVRALPKPNRICDLTVIEAIDLQLDVLPNENPPRLFVTAEFGDATDDIIQYTKISEKMVWNETMSLLLDEAKMDDSLVIRIWNNYPRKEEAIIGQKFFENLFFNKVTESSPIEDIVKAGKRASYILGKATIPMKAITPSTIFTWQIIDKKDPRFRKSLIKLKVDYTLKENEYFFPDSTVEYSVLLETLLRYELEESHVSGYWWDGKFTKLGSNLLEHYIKSKHLSKSLIKLTQWQIACKVQGTHPLAYSLFHEIVDDIATFIHNSIYTDQQLVEFWKSSVQLLENSVAMVKKFDFDNEKRVTNLLKTLQKISSIVSMSKMGLLGGAMFDQEPQNEIDKKARDSIEEILVDAIKENVKIWFETHVSLGVTNRDEEDGWISMEKNLNKFELEKLCQILSKMQQRLSLIKDVYAVPFKKFMNINLPEIYVTELDTVFSDHTLSRLQQITANVDFDIDPSKVNYEEQKSLQDHLKLFYLKLKNFNEIIMNGSMPSSKKPLKISDNHKWFDNFVTVWFKILGIETRKGIKKAIKLDEKLNLPGSSHTSSAADTFDLLYVLLVEFKQIVRVDHDKAFMIASEVVSEICDSIIAYFDEASGTLTPYWTSKSEETSLEKALVEKFGDVMNNVEYLANKSSEIIESIYTHILNSEDKMMTNKKYPGLAHLHSNLDKKILGLIKQLISSKILPQFQRHLKEALAFIGKDIYAFLPVTKYIDETMSALGSVLSLETFTVFSNNVWNELIVQLKITLERQIAQSQQDVQAFSSLKNFFFDLKTSFGDTEDAQITEENKQNLQFLEKELQKRGCAPLELLHSYYITLNEQQDAAKETFGTLTFSGTFNENGLNLHILNGRNLIPKTGVEGKTEPDTYVEVEFYFKDPSKYNLKSMKTKTIDKNQFPLYDEVMIIPLTMSEQSLEDTIIVFTLYDPDYYGMVQNYLGECSISLKELKEAGKQVMRNLWKPHDTTNECLWTLKNRTDKQARELYKSFKIRCTQNKKKSSVALPSLNNIFK